MSINTEERATGGAFVYQNESGASAKMTFSKAGDSMIIIDHTEVDGELRGQGVGEMLVEFMVNYARENQIKVMPLCPFTRSVFEKREDIRDVLK
jgi:predicted GNAT family acetyltransferase